MQQFCSVPAWHFPHCKPSFKVMSWTRWLIFDFFPFLDWFFLTIVLLEFIALWWKVQFISFLTESANLQSQSFHCIIFDLYCNLLPSPRKLHSPSPDSVISCNWSNRRLQIDFSPMMIRHWISIFLYLYTLVQIW